MIHFLKVVTGTVPLSSFFSILPTNPSGFNTVYHGCIRGTVLCYTFCIRGALNVQCKTCLLAYFECRLDALCASGIGMFAQRRLQKCPVDIFESGDRFSVTLSGSDARLIYVNRHSPKPPDFQNPAGPPFPNTSSVLHATPDTDHIFKSRGATFPECLIRSPRNPPILTLFSNPAGPTQKNKVQIFFG